MAARATQEIIATHIGDGAAMLVSRSLGEPEDCDYLESAVTYFLDYYREHKLDQTYVYPGVFESLDSLRDAGLAMAVLTNKPIGPPRLSAMRSASALTFFASRGEQLRYQEAEPRRLARPGA